MKYQDYYHTIICVFTVFVGIVVILFKYKLSKKEIKTYPEKQRYSKEQGIFEKSLKIIRLYFKHLIER